MLTITDPVKIKAAAAYNAAADHFDDEALSLWAKYGRRTVVRLALTASLPLFDPLLIRKRWGAAQAARENYPVTGRLGFPRKLRCPQYLAEQDPFPAAPWP